METTEYTNKSIIGKYHEKGFLSDEDYQSFMDYKKSLKDTMEEYERVSEMDITIPQSIISKFKQARLEFNELSKIHLFDLTAVAQFIVWHDNANNHTVRDSEPVTRVMAEKVLSGNLNENELEFVASVFEESDADFFIRVVRQLQTPVSDKHWYFSYRNANDFCPVETPMDATQLYDGKPHYVYIHSKNDARWGESYWISDNGFNSLESLPVIKAFKEYPFEVGHFYRIECTNTIYYGNNKKKYEMDISEVDEDEFMIGGFEQFAKR